MDKITLAAARVNAGKTQTELAKELGISKNILIDWEKKRKNPTEEQLYRYCAACGCNPTDVECEYIAVVRS